MHRVQGRQEQHGRMLATGSQRLAHVAFVGVGPTEDEDEGVQVRSRLNSSIASRPVRAGARSCDGSRSPSVSTRRTDASSSRTSIRATSPPARRGCVRESRDGRRSGGVQVGSPTIDP